MSKAIKVEDQVYLALDQIRGKSETFSQVIEELLEHRTQFFLLVNSIEKRAKYHEWRARQAIEASATIGSGDRSSLSNL